VEEPNENTISRTLSSAAIVRYAAPELIENNDFCATTRSDTYSFAMLILECFTEEVPFSNITHDAAVIHARVSKKQCPPRPNGREEKHRISEGLWDLMKLCWSVQPDHRPTMEQVHRFFLDLPEERYYNPPPPRSPLPPSQSPPSPSLQPPEPVSRSPSRRRDRLARFLTGSSRSSSTGHYG
jgi:hypothetical protein